jgi:hypothetical protein
MLPWREVRAAAEKQLQRTLNLEVARHKKENILKDLAI